jgi:Mg2+ and Co2+ transporter CorA
MNQTKSSREAEYQSASIEMEGVEEVNKGIRLRAATSMLNEGSTMTPRSTQSPHLSKTHLEAHTEETKGSTSKFIDDPDALRDVSTKLFKVNPFSKATQKIKAASLRSKIQQHHDGRGEEVLMLEITNSGEESFRHMRLRDLLEYVNDVARKIDETGHGYGVGKAKEKGNSSSRGASTSNLADLPGATPPDDPSAYCSAVNPLRLRDLRRLEPRFDDTDEGAALLVRWHAVLMSLDPIMAVILTNRVILIVPQGADSLLELVQDHIFTWVEDSKDRKMNFGDDDGEGREEGLSEKVSFEAHAYDALLTTVSSLLVREFGRLDKGVEEVLEQFQQKGCILSIDAQEKMRQLKNQASRMLTRLASFRRALNDVVEDDEGMALMNLTLLKDKPKLYKYPLSPNILGTHEEIEELLENYLNDYNSIESKLLYLKQQMQSAEELVSLRLDTARNQLLVANTLFAILACAIAFGSYFAGIFGMNLDNTQLESTPGLFAVIFGVSFAAIVLCFIAVVMYLRSTGTLPTAVSAD